MVKNFIIKESITETGLFTLFMATNSCDCAHLSLIGDKQVYASFVFFNLRNFFCQLIILFDVQIQQWFIVLSTDIYLGANLSHLVRRGCSFIMLLVVLSLMLCFQYALTATILLMSILSWLISFWILFSILSNEN